MKANTSDLPDINAIRHLQIGLSPSQPVHVYHHRYDTKQTMRFDMHYGVEVGVVLTGRMRRFYRDVRIEPGPGDVWLCGMWEPHGFEVIKAPCEVAVAVIWPPMLATQRFEEAPSVNWLVPFTVGPADRPRVQRNRRDHILELGRKVVHINDKGGPFAQVRLRIATMEILLALFEGWTASERPQGVYTDYAARISRALAMVFENRRMVTTQEAARACGMGRNSFGQAFKGLMGIGFSDFALRYRLNGAAAQLRATHDPIKAVAADWGFTDASHLHRCFVDAYGCSPGDYRERTAS